MINVHSDCKCKEKLPVYTLRVTVLSRARPVDKRTTRAFLKHTTSTRFVPLRMYWYADAFFGDRKTGCIADKQRLVLEIRSQGTSRALMSFFYSAGDRFIAFDRVTCHTHGQAWHQRNVCIRIHSNSVMIISSISQRPSWTL